MDRHLSKLVTTKEIFLLLALFCSTAHLAPTDTDDVFKNNEVTDEISDPQQLEADVKEPTTFTPVNSAGQADDDDVGPTQANDANDENDVQLPSEDATESTLVEETDFSDEEQTADYSSLIKFELQYSEYGSSYEPEYSSHTSSFSKPFFPPVNEPAQPYSGVNMGSSTEEGRRRQLQAILCSVLNVCNNNNGMNSNQVGTSEYDYYISSESAPDIKSNGINVQQPDSLVDDSDNETGPVESDNAIGDDTVSRNNLSGKSKSSRGHRVKRDLSWDMFGDPDDEDTQLYKEQLDILADLLNEGDDNVDIPEDNLVDVLDNIEGIRQDRLSAGDILEEFQNDMADLDDTDDALDNLVLRKRTSTQRDIMRHYVQSLPTLEGMRKRNGYSGVGDDFNDINGKAYPRDAIIAAENELAAEELEQIETQAQVAAAMLDDAARLIKLIEDTAVDLVGDYLGLDDDDDDVIPEADGMDNTIDFPVDFDEFPQYLPPVPPVSKEKRIGRQRTYDYPFVPEDIERPFKGAFESLSRPRGRMSRLRGSSSYRRPPPLRNPYQWSGGKIASAPYNTDLRTPIGIFPSDDFMRPRIRRNQGYYVRGSIFDDLFKSKRGVNSMAKEYEALPLIADDISTDDPNLWEMLARESPRIFPIDDSIMGRIGPNGRPYVDGVFTPYTKSNGDSLDKLWPLVNTVDRDIPFDAGLEEAYEAAAMMQDQLMEHDIQRLEEQNNSIGRMDTAAEDEAVGNLLSHIFRERIK